MPPVNNILYIDSAAELDSLCAGLRGAEWIALDTEFLREKTYYPKLCLLQLATPDVVACIDPLALEDLSPLLDIIFDENIIKVMHSGRQDLEIFYNLGDKVPCPVFDTQIAALMLGYSEQIGYANLVKGELGVELDKLHTRADWSLRPLTQDQIQYAADDVIYLADIYLRMRDRLAELGRADWLDEDFARLTNPGLYNIPVQDAWLKVKGGNRLRGESLSIMQALAGWREQKARRNNKPKGWILRDDALIDIARHKPDSLDALGKIRGLSEGLIRNSGNKIVELVNEADGKSPIPFPDAGKHGKLTPDQSALVDVMMALVRLSGEENNLNPTVLATRKPLERLVLGERDLNVLHGWRNKLVGSQLQAFLEGSLSLTVSNGRLAIAE